MDNQEQTKEIKQDGVDTSDNILSNQELTDINNKTQLDKLRFLTVTNSGVPTYTPQSFQEQFYFQDTGAFWVYMGDSWVAVSGGTLTKVGTTTSPSSNGTQVITVGFRPKLIRILASVNTTGTHAQSFGTATNTTDDQATCIFHYSTNTYMSTDFSTVIVDVRDETNTSVAYGHISDIDSTTFTIDWSTTTKVASLQWEAIG